MNLQTNNKRQIGAVLLVSMVILVALTMLGVTSMKSSLSELTMAGNLRESVLTFQAAEVGLKIAEGIIEDSVSTNMFNGATTSLLNVSTNDPDYLDETSWDNATNANIALENISTSPKYIIRYLGPRPIDPKIKGLNVGGGYGQYRLKELENFRVTSRGTGQTGNFFRVLQSYYAKEY